MQNEKVIIKPATIEDIDKIVEFIKEHWYIKNHVFVRERAVFEDQHLVDGTVNFILGIGEETGNIYGVCGYTISNRTNTPEIYPSLYQTIKSSNTMLGIDLMTELEKLTNARCLMSPGIRYKTKVIYDFMGFRTGMLAHYYRIADLDEYKVAKIENKIIPPVQAQEYVFKRFWNIEDVRKYFPFEKFKEHIPYKDSWCVDHRFFKNIGYKYKVYGIIKENGSCTAIFAGREVKCNGAVIFKIVDYIGEDQDIAFCSKAFDDLIVENGYEFIDIYEHGIPDEFMERAGMVKVRENDENIIPHYFEPFEQKNIDIYYYTSDMEGCHLFRSDGGQDRPNYI